MRKNHLLSSVVVGIILGFQVASFVASAANVCSMAYAPAATHQAQSVEELTVKVTQSGQNNFDNQFVATASLLNQYVAQVQNPSAQLVHFQKDILHALTQFDNFGYQVEVSKAVAQLAQQGPANAPSLNSSEGLFNALKNAWIGRQVPFFTQAQAEKRFEDYSEGKLSFKQSLGELSFEELQIQLFGPGKSINNITADSAMGRYLAECATVKNAAVATSISQFPKAPGSNELSGQEKLFIAIDQQTFPIYQKYFTGVNFFVHLHQPQQGTLIVGHQGQSYSYAGSSPGGDLRMQGIGSLWPTIIVSESEGQRLANYFWLGRTSRNAQNLYGVAQFPWLLVDKKEQTTETFCALGGYNSCTHWFGDIPFGETLVDTYMFPGRVDQYATNNGVQDAGPQRKKLGTYNASSSVRAVFSEFEQKVAERVWKPLKGHMQLWQVLGLQREQEMGELANPGYVAYSLLAGTNQTRVPFVFVGTQDATQALPTTVQMATQIRAY